MDLDNLMWQDERDCWEDDVVDLGNGGNIQYRTVKIGEGHGGEAFWRYVYRGGIVGLWDKSCLSNKVTH